MEHRTEGHERPHAAAAQDVRAWFAEWRDCASACALEFTRWMHAPRAERAGANATFVAALDREEAAAADLALAVALGPSWPRAAQRRAERPEVPARSPGSSSPRWPSRSSLDINGPAR
jgi:hypothetical protein